ncbi:hypothetical protein BJF79_40235 [Actinomadura sp. CNU-125]|nr:hypothetical protein BJF79_40235 [Actinomadura sp. CNU-125]
MLGGVVCLVGTGLDRPPPTLAAAASAAIDPPPPPAARPADGGLAARNVTRVLRSRRRTTVALDGVGLDVAPGEAVRGSSARTAPASPP